MNAIELTHEETHFVLNLLRQLTIAPAAPDAAQVVGLVQALLSKLQVTGE